MDQFKTLTFYPWGPTAPSSSHPQQVLVFCSTHDRPVYKINTFNNAIDVSSMGVFDKDGDYQCIAQYPLWLQSWPISQWEKNLLATHSPCVFESFSYYPIAAHLRRAIRTRKTLSIGSYDFEWRLAEVGGSPRVSDAHVCAERCARCLSWLISFASLRSTILLMTGMSLRTCASTRATSRSM